MLEPNPYHLNLAEQPDVQQPPAAVLRVIDSVTEQDVASLEAEINEFEAAQERYGRVGPKAPQIAHRLWQAKQVGAYDFLVMDRLGSALKACTDKAAPPLDDTELTDFVDLARDYDERRAESNQKFPDPNTGFRTPVLIAPPAKFADRLAGLVAKNDEAFEHVAVQLDRLPLRYQKGLIKNAYESLGVPRGDFKSLEFGALLARSEDDRATLPDDVWVRDRILMRYIHLPVNWQSSLEHAVIDDLIHAESRKGLDLTAALDYLDVVGLPDFGNESGPQYSKAMLSLVLRTLDAEKATDQNAAKMFQFLKGGARGRADYRPGINYAGLINDQRVVALANAVTPQVNQLQGPDEEALPLLVKGEGEVLPEACSRLMSALRLTLPVETNTGKANGRRLRFALFEALAGRQKAFIKARLSHEAGSQAVAQTTEGDLPTIRGRGHDYWNRRRTAHGKIS